MSNQRGDTIVEVLLATVVISIVLASAFTLTNRATRLNQTAVERTTISNLMREQIELVRGARTQGDSAAWREIRDNLSIQGSPTFDSCEPSSSSNPFWMDPDLALSFDDASIVQDYTDVANKTDAHPEDIFGVWMESYADDSLAPEYIDVYVRGCWEGIGGETEQTSTIVLRLAV